MLIDDFLANGSVIEKGFQIDGKAIRNLGDPLESVVIVGTVDAESGTIIFRKQ